MPAGIKQIVRWQGNSKIVTFHDTRLAGSVERFLEQEPVRTVYTNLDAPPGTYAVQSRSHPACCWEIRLDPERGVHVGRHNCPYRAERPHEDYPCVHIAGAWLRWKADRDEDDPFLQRLQAQQENEVSESTALATYQPQAAITTYHVPTRQEISDTLALGKVLMETRGAAIPQALDTPQKAAAVILAGRELGFDPMASFRHFFVVDGQTQPDGQALAALMQRGGADLVYHCDCEECADVELRRPGREPVRVKYTMAQALKAGSTGGTRKDGSTWVKPAWKNHPADMLIWKAIARLARRGAADLVNAVQSAMVRIEDYDDAVRQVVPEDVQEAVYSEQRPALAIAAESEPEAAIAPVQDAEEATTITGSEPGEEAGPSAAGSSAPTSVPSDAASSSPATATWRDVVYDAAQADKKAHFQALSDFQKAIRGQGALPPDCGGWTLGEIADAMTGGGEPA